MRRIKYQDIDKHKWDGLATISTQNDLFCKSWYLDICAGTWDAIVWGDYEAGFPLPTSSKGGVAFLYLPFFVRQLNILGQSDPQKWDALLQFIHEEFKRVDISIPKEADHVNHDFTSYVHQELDLRPGYEQLSAGYSNNAKRLIKKCSQLDFVVNEQGSPEKLIEHFKYETGRKIKTLQDSEYQILLNLMSHCLDNNYGKCLSIEQDGELLGSAFFMEYDDRVTFLKSYTSEEGKKKGVSYYLMDYAIRHYAARCVTFDFGGSKVESVAQFYKKFGAIDAFYLHLSFDKSPAYHKLMREVKRKITG